MDTKYEVGIEPASTTDREAFPNAYKLVVREISRPKSTKSPEPLFRETVDTVSYASPESLISHQTRQYRWNGFRHIVVGAGGFFLGLGTTAGVSGPATLQEPSLPNLASVACTILLTATSAKIFSDEWQLAIRLIAIKEAVTSSYFKRVRVEEGFRQSTEAPNQS